MIALEKNKKTFFLHAKGNANDKNLDNYVCHSFQARYTDDKDE